MHPFETLYFLFQVTELYVQFPFSVKSEIHNKTNTNVPTLMYEKQLHRSAFNGISLTNEHRTKHSNAKHSVRHIITAISLIT